MHPYVHEERPGKICTVVIFEWGHAWFLFFIFLFICIFLISLNICTVFVINKSYFLFKRGGETTRTNNASKPNNMRK